MCYRKGGYAAITDANLVLGRILPEFFPNIFGPNGTPMLCSRFPSCAAFWCSWSTVNILGTVKGFQWCLLCPSSTLLRMQRISLWIRKQPRRRLQSCRSRSMQASLASPRNRLMRCACFSAGLLTTQPLLSFEILAASVSVVSNQKRI